MAVTQTLHAVTGLEPDVRNANASPAVAVTQTPHAASQPLGNVQNANASPADVSIALEADCVNRKTARYGRLCSMGDDIGGCN